MEYVFHFLPSLSIVLASESSKVCCLQLLMLLLPPINRGVLQHLLDLLSQVARQPENLMDAQNIGLVFAPTLFLASRHVSYKKKKQLQNAFFPCSLGNPCARLF